MNMQTDQPKAEGYRTQPLSDEMERRIRERLEYFKIQLGYSRLGKSILSKTAQECLPGNIAALEWVLREAENMR